MGSCTRPLIFALLVLSIWSASGARSPAADYTVVPSASISQVFNDNVFGTETNRLSDTITILQPGITFGVQGPFQRQALTYAPYWEIFWKNEEQRSFSHQGSYLGEFQMSPRTALNLLERAAYSPETTMEFFPQSVSEPQLVRVRTFRSSTEVTPVFQTTERSQLEMRTRFYLVRYEQTLAQEAASGRVSNSYQLGERASWSFRLNERDTLTPAVSYDYFWFTDASDSMSIGADLAWSRQWTEAWQTGIGSGLVQTLQSSGSGRTTDVTASASAQFALKPWTFRGSYLRGVVAAAGVGSVLLQDTATLGSTLALGEDWILHLNLGYFHSSATNQGGQIQGFFAGGGAQYQILKWLFSSLTYNFRIQDSGGGLGASFPRNLASLTLSATYPSAQTEVK